jgi:hypothetical protein
MKPLWTRPACGERFVSPNLWHSCGRQSYERLLPLRTEADVDAEVRRWMRQAFRIGRQEHLMDRQGKGQSKTVT